MQLGDYDDCLTAAATRYRTYWWRTAWYYLVGIDNTHRRAKDAEASLQAAFVYMVQSRHRLAPKLSDSAHWRRYFRLVLRGECARRYRIHRREIDESRLERPDDDGNVIPFEFGAVPPFPAVLYNLALALWISAFVLRNTNAEKRAAFVRTLAWVSCSDSCCELLYRNSNWPEESDKYLLEYLVEEKLVSKIASHLETTELNVRQMSNKLKSVLHPDGTLVQPRLRWTLRGTAAVIEPLDPLWARYTLAVADECGNRHSLTDTINDMDTGAICRRLVLTPAKELELADRMSGGTRRYVTDQGYLTSRGWRWLQSHEGR